MILELYSGGILLTLPGYWIAAAIMWWREFDRPLPITFQGFVWGFGVVFFVSLIWPLSLALTGLYLSYRFVWKVFHG